MNIDQIMMMLLLTNNKIEVNYFTQMSSKIRLIQFYILKT